MTDLQKQLLEAKAQAFDMRETAEAYMQAYQQARQNVVEIQNAINAAESVKPDTPLSEGTKTPETNTKPKR